MATATKKRDRGLLDFLQMEKNVWAPDVKLDLLVRSIRHGLPMSAFVALKTELDVGDTVLARIVDISPRTLTRRKQEGRLQPAESDRLWRIGYLFERASKLLGGPERAREWFKRPKKALGGKTPLEYTDTEPGAIEVEDLLGRLEHGVFS